MALIEQLVARAKANKQRIVLPEGTEERTLKAADRILADEVADLILIGDPAEIKALAQKNGLSHIEKATIINPLSHDRKEEYAQLLAQLRAKKGVTIDTARSIVENPLYLGCLIIKAGDADGQALGSEQIAIADAAGQPVGADAGDKEASGRHRGGAGRIDRR